MSSAKEREILERQRLLAARLKPSSGPGAVPVSRALGGSSKEGNAKKPPPKPKAPPSRPSTISVNARNCASFSRPTNGNTIWKGDGPSADDCINIEESPRETSQPPMSIPKRPALKRAGHGRSSSTAARTKLGDQVSASEQRPKPPPPRSINGETKPSPKLQRKALPKTQVSSLLAGATSLATLIKHVAHGSNNDDETQSLQTHKPDDFWKNLRDWDLPSQLYYETRQQQQQQRQQQQQPNDENSDAIIMLKHTRKSIPNTFVNARHYVAAWAPLCMDECRSQLLQEVAQNETVPVLVQVEATDSRIRYRRDHGAGEDAPWMEENETGGYVMIKSSMRDSMRFFPNDIVLLVQKKFRNVVRDIVQDQAVPPNGADLDSATVFAGISLIGHTESSRSELNGLIVKVSKRKWTVNGTKEMYLIKVGSNVTALREYTALCNVDTLPMKAFLLGQHLEKAESRRKLSRHQSVEQLLHQIGGAEQLGNGFLSYAAKKFNPSQLTAIAASAHEYGEGGFTCIKGPPGTGKTTTLVAVLNSLHIRQYNKYYSEVRNIAAKGTGVIRNALHSAHRAKPRLLVCAPSNAAIDNIILKIKEDGFVDGRGCRYNPSMIRVGAGLSSAVRDISLIVKVDEIMAENKDAQEVQASIIGFSGELSRIDKEITRLRARALAIENASPWPVSGDWEIRIDENEFDQKRKAYFVNHPLKTTTYEIPPPPEPGQTQWKFSAMPEYTEYVGRLGKLVDNYFSMESKLDRCKTIKKFLDGGTTSQDARFTLETHVLNSVHMVMTTLGTAGNRILETVDKFEVIVVDEAAQSVEPAILSALRLGSRHAVLVGDPQQLPATIFNVSGKNSKYDRSLFQRLEEAGQPTYMLDEQYRMHPKISHFPRHIFYKGALLDGCNVSKPDYGNPMRDIICRAIPAFSPLVILNLDSTEERGGTSLSNLTEAKLAVFLYSQLKAVSGGRSASSRVAVITPYAKQQRLLRECFSEHLGPTYEKYVEVSTVDGFQGREANIVIFSAVRASGSNSIGFLSDVRRFNVALTRARVDSVTSNQYWADFVTHARETNAVVDVPLIGQGETASFGRIESWKQEDPNNSNGNSLPLAPSAPTDDTRKDPRKRKHT